MHHHILQSQIDLLCPLLTITRNPLELRNKLCNGYSHKRDAEFPLQYILIRSTCDEPVGRLPYNAQAQSPGKPLPPPLYPSQKLDPRCHILSRAVDNLPATPHLLQIREDLHRRCEGIALARGEDMDVPLNLRECLQKQPLCPPCHHIDQAQVTIPISGKIATAIYKFATAMVLDTAQKFECCPLCREFVVKRRGQGVDKNLHTNYYFAQR